MRKMRNASAEGNHNHDLKDRSGDAAGKQGNQDIAQMVLKSTWGHGSLKRRRRQMGSTWLQGRKRGRNSNEGA